MDTTDVPTLSLAENGTHLAKRKRSISAEAPPTPIKLPKSHNNQLQINYLTQQYLEPLPLISVDDPLPTLLSLLHDYEGVLVRHESMAGNLGARPLGPMLVKRFERMFDGPPRVLKSHGKEGTSVGWLDVVEFAKNKPEQFNLEKTRDSVRVCQFYTKQSRVEITEDDYELIASGIPEKMIPSQPIVEDEEKELGTLEILDKNVAHITNLADQVSARARQLIHRLKNRQKAILSRREADVSATSPFSPRSFTYRVADMGQSAYQSNGDTRTSMSPSSGFTAVNSRQSDLPNGSTSSCGASAATRAELLSKFFTNSERAPGYRDNDTLRRTSNQSASRPRTSEARPKQKSAVESDYYSIPVNSTSPNPVPIPNTPSSLLPYVKPSAAERFDDSGPYKAEMVSRMELLQRGDRVQPPCDRCRRLHMDCLKNLTACLGCTKKHAKCSWKDVTDDELRDYVPPESRRNEMEEGISEHSGSQTETETMVNRDHAQGVRDEELLGEDESDDSVSGNEAPKGHGRCSPIQIHVAGSLQDVNGAPVVRDEPEDLDVDLEPEVRHDIAALQDNEPAALPSPPGAPIPAPASLPDIVVPKTEAPPDTEMKEQKDLVPTMSPPPVKYDASEDGRFSSINGNGTYHGLPNPQEDTPPSLPNVSSGESPFGVSKARGPTEVAYASISTPRATLAPMASMTSVTMGSPVGRTEA